MLTKRRSITWAGRCLAVAVLVAAQHAPLHAAELTEQEARGRKIYDEGESESGAPITAQVARGAVPVAASFLPCSGCHGADGRGRPEGGVRPSDITWSTLTATLGHEHDYGRSHAAFDEPAVARAVMAGEDPAGNMLDLAMPRYSMSAADMADLTAYLQVIETDLDPGLTADSIRLGTLLPLEGPLAGVGQAMQSVLEAYFTDINAGGGIHGRRIELVVGEYATEALRGGWNARDFLQRESVFALVGGYLSGIEKQVAALAEEKEVPLVGPYTVAPEDGDGLYRYSFYLLGGLAQQAQILARHASTDLAPAGGRLAIIRPTGAPYDAAATALKDPIVRALDREPLTINYSAPYFDAASAAQTLHQKGVTTVIFFGVANDLRRLADEAWRRDWKPDLLLPGVFASKGMFDIPADYEGRVFLGYSSMPSDHTPKGVSEFETLHAEHRIDYRHSALQISAFVAAKVLVEGLKRSGKDLSRERLVRELEGLADFQPGLMPPISYNVSRRIGALGGYVVALDLERKGFGEASKWIELQP